MLDIVFYSIMEVLSGLAPELSNIFDLARLLYGVGMGGAWGVGASLAMESVPAKIAREFFPGFCRRGTRSAICSPPSPSGRFSRAGAGALCSSSALRPHCSRW